MSRIVRAGLIQARLVEEATASPKRLRELMVDKHVSLIERAAGEGVEILCLQELFYGPYF